MPTDNQPSNQIDWSLTTWEGARREQTRRWSQMSLAQIISALEEMQVLAERLAKPAEDSTSR